MADGTGDEASRLANSLATRLNVDAPVFVPNFGPAPSVQSTTMANSDSQPSSGPSDQNHIGVNNHVNIESSNVTRSIPVESPSDPTSEEVDDWEKRADDEEEEAMDEDEEDAPVGDEVEPKPKPKRTKKVSVCVDGKDHWNIVFIGHVDAGKSTIGGQILNLTGMVDKRTLEKYEREAKEKNRESWYLSWALDTNQEERDKGKTVEVGRAFFTTEHKHFTLLDAPG